jgi:hypothetical protein
MQVRATSTPFPCQSFIVGDILGLPESPELRCKNFAQHTLGSGDGELAICISCARKVAVRADAIGTRFKKIVALMEQVSA